MKTNLKASSQLSQGTRGTTSPSPRPCSLRNTHGFWELTFRGHYATVPQHPALFFVAWLLANPPKHPLPAIDLLLEVNQAFSTEPDYRENLSLAAGLLDNETLASIFSKKEDHLLVIIDSSDETDVVKAEAQRELTVLQEFHRTLIEQNHETQKQIATRLTTGLIRLHAILGTAVDLHHNPHTVLRAFACHLLLYLIVPSIQVSHSSTISQFTYQPPAGITWSA